MLLLVFRMALLVYLGLLLLLFGCQTRFIFPATRGSSLTPEAFGWPYEDIRLPVGGYVTHGWYIPTDGAHGTILFSHGNGGNVDQWLGAMDVYRRMGYNVLLYDYGGYGVSTGRPSEQRCYEDARAMWRWLTETRGVPPDTVVVVGRSLGAGVAAQLAIEVTPRAIVMESPFLSVPAMARLSFPFMPNRLLVRHVFDNESKMPKISAPVLIVHSPDDTLVPYSHGKRLFDLVRTEKAFLTVRGDHNDWAYTSEAIYEQGLRSFLDRIEE